MAHGITTIREPGSFNGLEWVLDHKKRSDKNQIVGVMRFSYISKGGFAHSHDSQEDQEAMIYAPERMDLRPVYDALRTKDRFTALVDRIGF